MMGRLRDFFTKRLDAKDITRARSPSLLGDCKVLMPGPGIRADGWLDRAIALIGHNGYRIRTRKKGGSSVTDPIRRVVWWSSRWEKIQLSHKVPIAWEEFAHVLQQRRTSRFSSLYILKPRRRWAFEVAAKRVRIFVAKQLGYREAALRAYVRREVRGMQDNNGTYKLWRLRDDEIEEHTTRLLLEAVGLKP